MQLGRQTARPQVIDAAHEAGIQIARAEQLEKGGFRIGARDHGAGRNALAGFEHDARCTISLDQNARHRRGGANHGAGRGRGPGQGIAQGAHAALGLRQCTAACGFGRQAIQERQHGAGRARTEVRTEHGVEGERALKRRRLELLFEQIVHVHAADAQQFAHVAPPQPANAPTQAQQRERIPPITGAETRRHARQQRHQGPREASHLRRVPAVGGCIRALQIRPDGERRAVGRPAPWSAWIAPPT